MIPSERRIKIDEQKGSVSVAISLQMYPLESVFRTASEYSKACWAGTNSTSASEVVVTLSPKQSLPISLENLAREFCNHLLG